MPVAVRLAERLDATVDVVSVADRADVPARREYLLTVTRQLGEIVESSEVIAGVDVADHVVGRVAGRADSSIVLDGGGPSRTSGVLSESLAAELLAVDETVVIVGPHAVAGAADLPIVACIDGSVESEQVLPVAARWADQLAVPLVVVMVMPTPLQAIPGVVPPPRSRSFDPEAVLENAAAAVSLHWPRLLVSSRLITYPWNVADAMEIYLERHPTQLVAVATHVRHGWDRLTHPSTTAHLVRQLTVPMIVVPIEPDTPIDPSDEATTAPMPGHRPFRHIIVPIKPDLDGARPTVNVAKALAAAGTDVTLWTCRTSNRAPHVAEHEAAELLDSVRPARAVWRDTEEPDVVDALIDYARATPSSIICLGTHAPGRLRDTLTPTVTGQIIRWSPRTVVLVGPRARLSPDGFDEVVGCIDGSLISEAVAELTGLWAAGLNRPGRLLQVVDPATRMPGTSTIADRYVGRLATRTAARHDVCLQAEVIEGAAVASRIVEWAKEHPAALLVMASHGTGLSEHVLGGVITDVVRHAPNPVVVVPAHPARGQRQITR